MKKIKQFVAKPIYMFWGIIFVILGVIGAFLPVLPTTPFLILAAFCFSKSNQYLHDKLLAIPQFGDAIRDWEEYRSIKKRSKILAISMIVIFVSFSMYKLWSYHIAIRVLLFLISSYGIWFVYNIKTRD